jgi:hypothetical protein
MCDQIFFLFFFDTCHVLLLLILLLLLLFLHPPPLYPTCYQSMRFYFFLHLQLNPAAPPLRPTSQHTIATSTTIAQQNFPRLTICHMSDSEAAPAAAAQNQLDKKSVAKKPRAKAAPKEPKEPKVPLISAHKHMKI